MSWFPLFLHLFALGTAGSVAAVPPRPIGRYYFKFHMTVVLVMVTVAVLIGKPWEGEGALAARAGALLFAGVVLAENVLVRAAKGDLSRGALLLPLAAGLPFVTITALASSGYGVGRGLLLVLHLYTAAAVLGTSLVAMSTGHWYLANAALPFDILVRLCSLFVASVVAKAVVSGVYAVVGLDGIRSLEPFDVMVLGVRVAAGILLAGLLGGMSLACAKRKANQSATGILYVAVVFVLIGETISMYLTFRARGAVPI